MAEGKASEDVGDAHDGWEWMALEIFGHRAHAGRVREEERFGAKLLRIDIPVKGDPDANGWETRFYGGSSIFSMRLITRETALNANKPYEPPARLSLPNSRASSYDEEFEGEGRDDDADGDLPI